MQLASFVKIKFEFVSLSSRTENTKLLWLDNSVKNWQNLPISNFKPDPHNINAHTKFCENPLIFTKGIVQKQTNKQTKKKKKKKKKKPELSRSDHSVTIWRNLTISNSKPDLYNTSAHTKFGENPFVFTQVVIRKRKYGRTNTRTATWNHNTPPLSCGS